MKYNKLGRTSLSVSACCLGSMTWGAQNSLADAHAQLDFAIDHGVNFVDVAEIYPVPTKAETYGQTEDILGNWLKSRGHRAEIIIATKVTGPNASRFPYIRDGQPRLDRSHIRQAVENSLTRLKTDYIDLYQTHWPERHTNFFGQLGYSPAPHEDAIPLEETLDVLGDLVKEGKIRHVGASNESAWGVMRMLHLAAQSDRPRLVSVQNPYSLLNRSFEIGLAEIAHRENCGLLAYSPLAFGTLTGKYLQGACPPGSRYALPEIAAMTRYRNPHGETAVAAYCDIAKRHDLDPAQMALAFVKDQAFVTATIIGATSLTQLKANLEAFSLTLTTEVKHDIEEMHRQKSNPCP